MRTIEDTDGKGLPGQSEIPAPAITAEEWNLARRAAAERITAPALKEEVTTVPGPASIAELARALKNDVDLIYEWMYSNVDYYCTYSTRKGALGALIDRSAGPFDQAMLMVKLLRQAGYTASYVVGTIRFTTAQLENLLGTQDTASVYPSVNVINAGGIPNTPTYDDAGNLLYIDMAHCWVQVAISGTNYVFDPSIKTYSYTTGVDIGTITGFDLAALLNDAQSGATITNDYIQNLNAEKIRNDFSQYASNLLEWIRANKFDAGMKDIIGGKEIQVLPPGPVRQTSLPYQAPGSDTTIYPGELDDQYRPMFNIHGGGLNTGNLYCDQYYGSRLTITFTTAADGKVIPSLKANGVVLATGTEQPQNTTIAIDTAVGFIAGWENGIYSDPNSIYFIALAY